MNTRNRHAHGRRWLAALAVAAVGASTLGIGAAAAAAAPRAEASDPRPAVTPAATAPDDDLGARPYMGWSSYSMQVYAGNGSTWITADQIIAQSDAMHEKLQSAGYEYINIDAAWNDGVDEYGRPTPSAKLYPNGLQAVIDHIHGNGQKVGLYAIPGISPQVYEADLPIYGAPDCSTGDIVKQPIQQADYWGIGYRIDFSNPCAQKYVDSQARMIADWGYDFLKIDGVGPGSFKSGDNYDNRADIAAWQKAIAATGRPIHLELSWSLDYRHVADWKKYSNGWRIDTDVECYCNTLVTWENSVDDRWDDAPAWTDHAGPGGWNDLDSLNVGNGEMDGLTKAERQSYATLWAIAKSPLFTGDDITKLDSYGLSLLTNREVIAINQSSAPPAEPVTASDPQQVWAAKNPDGTYTVALFNLSDAPASVTANWQTLGFKGKAAVRDVWNKEGLGTYTDKITQALPAHGSRLFTVTPRGTDLAWTAYEAEAGSNTLSGNASVADCSACSGGKKVGNLYVGGKVTVNDVVVAKAGTYQIKVAYVSGDARSVLVSAGDGGATSHKLPSTGDWGTVNSVYVPVKLKAGTNTVVFDSGTGYAPDIDRIDVPKSL